MEENKISAEITQVRDVLKMSLAIPHYQRPYCWEEENVGQLLNDILESQISGKKTYRIGSVILYKDKDKAIYDIVDGQQRLTTILLLGKVIQDNYELVKLVLKFNHSNSYKHIKENFDFIKKWVSENPIHPEEFWHYVTNNCEFVKVVVDDLSEAFQMFESQNGRGKELEAYNLIKAYHIRAMEQNTRDEKILCDRRWEAAIEYDATPSNPYDKNIDLLKQLFSEQLYRTRIWSRGKEAYSFSKKQIGEFKGFTVDKNHPIKYPFQNPQLLQYLTSKFYNSVLKGTIGTLNRFETGDCENIDPFVSINQTIVNGKNFFDYVETYVEIYKRMFFDLDSYQLAEFKEFYFKYCLNYNIDAKGKESEMAFCPRGTARRTGDTYLREAYKSIVFLLFDKFGEKGLNKYYKVLYRLIYIHRLKNKKVFYNTVAKLPQIFFDIIYNAKDLSDLIQFEKMARNLNVNDINFSIAETIDNFIKNEKK